MRARVGEPALRGLARGQPAEILRALGDDRSPLATLVRLFCIGAPVADDDVAVALPLDDAAPLLDRAGGELRAGYDVSPHADDRNDWWVVADRTDRQGRPRRADHVLGVGGASTTLAELTVRRPVDRALDVGTGCGVQALHLSTHSAHVTATDTVPRALRLAATTFALSGTDAELRLGDLVEPVVDRAFDLVVCNPPFVVGPATRFAYRDAGGGDETSRRAVRAAASVLAPGGVAQLLVNWERRRGEDWRDRVAEWVTGLGCDAWLLERDAQDPVDYVATWLADAGEHDDERLAAEWLRWLAERDVEGVGFGWVVLRRGDGPHRVAVEVATQPVDQPLGPQVADWLDRVEWLRVRTDADLLRHPLRAAPGVRLDTVARPGAGGWERVGATLALDDGFRWSLPCDEPTGAIVAGCDGTRPLSALVAVLALTTGIDEAHLAPAVCATVRGLVDRAVLLP